MNEDDIFPGVLSDHPGAPTPTPSLEEPDYGAWDYARLPDSGRHHYSLEDGALLAALDWWLEGRIATFPRGDLGPYDQDDPVVRKGVAPTQQLILAMLIREVEAGRLRAEILERRVADSSIVVERTYVQFDDLLECLDRHGPEHGEYLDTIGYDKAETAQADAEEVARDRAQLRYGHKLSSDFVQTPIEDGEQHWKAVARDRALQIAVLQAQIDGRPALAVAPLGIREKKTLLAIIAVLCKEAKLDYTSASKTADLLYDTAVSMGVDLGKTTIKNKLRDVQNALGTRMK